MERIEELLLWARSNRFRVREIEAGGVRLVLEDLGTVEEIVKGAGPARTPETEQKSIHAAWAEVLGVPFVETDDDDEQEART